MHTSFTRYPDSLPAPSLSSSAKVSRAVDPTSPCRSRLPAHVTNSPAPDGCRGNDGQLLCIRRAARAPACRCRLLRRRVTRTAGTSARCRRLLFRRIACPACTSARRRRLLLCLAAPTIKICKCHDLTSFIWIPCAAGSIPAVLTHGDQAASLGCTLVLRCTESRLTPGVPSADPLLLA